MADTDIQLKVSLDTTDVQSKSSSLQKEIKRIFDVSGGKQLDSQMNSVLSKMSKLSSQAQTTEKALKDMENSKMQELADTARTASEELSNLDQKIAGAKVNGEDVAALEKEKQEWEEIANNIARAQQYIDKVGISEFMSKSSDKYNALQQALRNTNNEMTVAISKAYKLDPALRNAFEKKGILQKFKDGIKGIGDTIKTHTVGALKTFKDKVKDAFSRKPVSKFGSVFKSVLGAMLGAQTLIALFNKLKQAIMEGINNLAQFKGGNNEVNQSLSTLMSSLTQLKNALAVAFAPILSVVIPILNSFIQVLITAANAIGMFFAKITGKSTVLQATKVNQNYAKSLGGAGKSAKKAAKDQKEMNNALADYDELKLVQKQDEQKDSGSSGGGGGGGVDPSSMFEEVPVTSQFEELSNILDKVKKKAVELWDAFKGGFFDALGDVGPRLETIKKGLAQIKQALIDIFTDPQVLEAMNTWALSFARMLGMFVGMAASIGLTIAANLIGGLGQYMEENTDRIKQFLIDMFDVWTEVNDLLSDFFIAFADVFSVFADTNGIECTAAIIGIFADAFMGILELASRVIRDVIQLLTVPFVQNSDKIKKALDGLLGSLATVLKGIKDIVDYVVDNVLKLYDEHIKPFIDDVTEGISEIVGTLLDGWNTYMQPVLDEVAEMITDTFETYLKPVIDELLGLIGDIIDIADALWNEHLQPFLNWVAENIMPVLSPIVKNLSKIIKGVLDVVLTVVEGALKALRSLIKFVKEGFTKDWSTAWTNLKKSFGEIWEAMRNKIKAPINGIISGVESMINGIIRAFNSFANLIGSMSFTVPDWVPFIGGNEFKISLPQLSTVSIPRLAQGAVIPPNNEFLAMLGDQKSGTNIEAPLDTIVEAFRQAMSEGTGSNAPIVLQLDGRTVAETVWDESDKRYKQTGVRYGFA